MYLAMKNIQDFLVERDGKFKSVKYSRRQQQRHFRSRQKTYNHVTHTTIGRVLPTLHPSLPSLQKLRCTLIT